MNLTEVNSIGKYNKLLGQLGSWGWFQKKLALFSLLFWLMAGIVRTIFNKDVFCNSNEQLPFFTLSIIAGLFVSAYLSYYYNRRKVMMGLSALYTVGGLLILLSFTEGFEKVGIYMVSMAQYSVSVLASCIMFEYIDPQYIPLMAWCALFSCHVGKFVSVVLFAQFNDSSSEEIILSSLIILFGVVQVGLSYFYKESLRYLIDNDIEQAEQLALEISQANDSSEDKLINMIEGSFVWGKVNIKKYGLSSFNKYKSLARETYYLGTGFFCLGVFGKLAIVVFKINETKKSAQFQHDVQLLWISVFQLLGFLPGIVVEKILPRKKVSLVSALAGLLFSILLVILIRYAMTPHFLVIIFSLLGLNSFLGSVLFFFMFLQAVQFYPHTVRTLGLSLCLCCYYLGQLLFNLHLDLIKDVSSSLQLVFCCCFLMILHLYNTSETLGQGVKYEIKEIEEREYNED